ncbi:response regulator [Mucilaginibacter pedocola]|uniref:Response regulatory domain-containing protein n=1 Tax=Mucilaginibacter pedocola TaxID=1792845 RepID=A0A1S9PAY8_9SPHI|nr:response regulator [Mucilaginibacter pedocola]OOQ57758.1 hypothetical protein BC343_13285 [Mucilaginibacter pedocola]
MSIRKVCIIDDDEIYTCIIKRMIAGSGLASSELFFPNGQEAIEFFKSNISGKPDALPDVILLDINMPVLDGWQFLDKFSLLDSPAQKDIPIFIVSSSIDEKDHRKAKSYPQVLDYVVKPVSLDSLKKLFDKVAMV